VAGAGGFLGAELVARLRDRGDDVVRLVRRSPQAPGEIEWDPAAGEVDSAALEGVDALVSLGGVGIGDRRWTEEHRRAVLESRVQVTETLATAIASLKTPPQIFVSASAIGFYGDRGEETLTETSIPGAADDFLVRVVQQWEAAASPAVAAGVNTAFLRTGIVLGEGGALSAPVQVIGPIRASQLLLFKLGVGGPFGGGKQWWSWISMEDQMRATMHIIDNRLTGAFNLTAPNPVRQRDLAKSLGRHLKRPAIVPTPRFVIQAALGKDRAQALVFTSARVIPEALQKSGFDFTHPDLDGAWESALGS
jgi:uncharacterized protein (TIGR01777 family)